LTKTHPWEQEWLWVKLTKAQPKVQMQKVHGVKAWEDQGLPKKQARALRKNDENSLTGKQLPSQTTTKESVERKDLAVPFTNIVAKMRVIQLSVS
jgi:hypothetical protein